MKNKKAFEFSFGWLFALLVGAVILFLAIYAVTNLVDNLRLQKETETGKDIGTILSPVETTLEKAKYAELSVSQPTKLFNDCTTSGSFGSQLISTKIKSGIGGAWRAGETIPSTFHNKYLFSDAEVEAENKFVILSKPFEFPFKIADIMIMWSDHGNYSYCFVDINTAPGGMIEGISAELSSVFAININNTDFADQCSPTSRRVCHEDNAAECNDSKRDIIIHGNYVERDNGQELYYEYSSNPDNEYPLLLAAIFSNKTIYDCQVQRLMMRANNLARTYQTKITKFSPADTTCNFGNLNSLLQEYKNNAQSIARDGNIALLSSIKSEAINLQTANEQISNCKLF